MFQPGQKEDEEIHLFRTDALPDARKKLGLKAEQRCCDGLLYYRHDQESPLLVLIELKGRKQSAAAGQFLSLYKILQMLMNGIRFPAYALLVTESASVRDRKEITMTLKKAGLKTIFIAGHGSNWNLRNVDGLPLCPCKG